MKLDPNETDEVAIKAFARHYSGDPTTADPNTFDEARAAARQALVELGARKERERIVALLRDRYWPFGCGIDAAIEAIIRTAGEL